MGRAAVEELVRFVAGLEAAPSVDLDGADAVASRFVEPLPETGRPFDELLGDLGEASAKSIDPAHPGFLGYIPGGGLYASAVAAFLAFGTNRFVNMWETAPALAQIEATVIRWMADLFGLPSESMGILTSGGSIANLSAIVTARTTMLGDDFQAGTLYASEHVHHSVRKAAMIAGFPPSNVRTVPTTPDLRIDVEALEEAIERDARDGMRPFCVVASAGTTNTGTVDPLPRLVEVARRREMWIHVDAAYGGFFQLTERGRMALQGISGADSITLDPHKGLFLPYGTGCLLVRDGELLRRAHKVEAAYMQDRSEGDIPNFCDYSPELSRDFRGLRVWLPIQLHGIAAFREALDEKLDLARYAAAGLSEIPGVEVPWEPELSTVTFRYAPGSGDEDQVRLLKRINDARRIYLTSTTIGGRFVLRVCVLSHRTHRRHIDEGLDVIRRAAEELFG